MTRGSWKIAVRTGIGTALLMALIGCEGDTYRVPMPRAVTPPPTSALFPMFREQPAWSRTGLIAYRDRGIVSVSKYGGYQVDTSRVGIWILDPVTGQKFRFLPWGDLPAWSPDGENLVFFKSGQLFRINRDGSGLRQLTFSGGCFPSWHPNGQVLAYDSNAGSPTGSNTVWVMDADGGNKRRFCPPQPGERRMACWSPNGGQLAFVWSPGGDVVGSEVYLADSSCGVTRLTFLGGLVNTPTFSPDGARIAFMLQSLSDPLPQIWLINLDGSEQRQVTVHGGMWPAWSPDGNELVYVNAEWRYSAPGQGELWIVDLRTGRERLLTSHGATEAPLP